MKMMLNNVKNILNQQSVEDIYLKDFEIGECQYKILPFEVELTGYAKVKSGRV
jgi:hypothetical protein